MKEQMTDHQFDSVLKMILDIIESSESKEEAIEKIKKYIDEK